MAGIILPGNNNPSAPGHHLLGQPKHDIQFVVTCIAEKLENGNLKLTLIEDKGMKFSAVYGRENIEGLPEDVSEFVLAPQFISALAKRAMEQRGFFGEKEQAFLDGKFAVSAKEEPDAAPEPQA